MREEKLVDNVRETGKYLGELLHQKLDDHPHVGDVRGRGLFWGVSVSTSSHFAWLLKTTD